MKQLLIACLLGPLAALASPAAAPAPNPGVIFEIETVAAPGEPPQRVDAAIEGTNARIAMPGQSGDAIFRGDRREMLILNHDDRSYVVMDEAAMKQLQATLGQAMSQMDQMLQNMPPEQRARVEEMMKGRGMAMPQAGAARAELRPTSERATHNGFATTKYEVYRGGRKTQELWVTPWNNVDGVAEARPVFESMAEFFQGLMTALGPMGATAADASAFSYMKELPGFPVVTQTFDDTGAPTSRSTLLGIRREAVPPAQFEPPAGYRQQALPGSR